MKLGKDLILALSGEPIAAAKSCSIQQSQSFIEVASPTSGRWKQVVPSMLEWGISANTLLGTYAAYNTLDQAWRNGTAVTIRYYDTEYNCNKTGTAYIADIRLEGPVGSLAQMSIQLQGSGELSDYGGTEIQLTTLQGGEQGAYYYVVGNFAYYDDHYQESEYNIKSFTLTERTKIRFALTNYTVIFSKDSSLIQDADNRYTIDLQERNASDFQATGEIWLDAGTYYNIFSTDDASVATYKVFKIS